MAILVPMCMRTHLFLNSADQVEPGRWRCDGRKCGGDAHMYKLDGDRSRDVVDRALRYVASRFDVEVPSVTVWSSPGAIEWPETTRGIDQGIAIYLTATTAQQSIFQAGHEVFHVVTTPLGTHHWLHEMLACVFALEFARSEGLSEYCQIQINEDDRFRPALPLATFVSVDAMPYPVGMYQRASVFGRDLARAVGSDVLFEARSHWTADGRPDYWGWVDSLPGKVRSRVIRMSPDRAVTT